jgi:CRISPR/Cas system CMR-associated protein Cmr5 small subunit
MHLLKLPTRVYESGSKEFLKLISSGNGKEHVRIDFENSTYLTPLANVFLIVKILEWNNNKQKVDFINHKTCNNFKYLQRINFFDNCGIKLDEDFTRHSSSGKFVEIKSLKKCDIGELSTEIAECIAPELSNEFDSNKLGFFNCIEYSISELGNNTVQHAQASNSYVNAQYSSYPDLIRVAIIDNGIGIKESFFLNNSPYSETIITDLDAILIALEAEKSSKTHLNLWGESVNAGLGLTLLKSISEKINGTFIIFTGNAYYSLDEQELFDETLSFKGTLCSFTFKRSEILNFNNLLYDIKKEIGLIPNTLNIEHEELFI